MKIHQLPHGARFEYEGEEYVKTAPMFATNAAGQQRMIPKYAVLKPLDAAATTPKAPRSETIPRTEILAAFAAYHARIAALVPADQQAALDAARAGFLSSLGE